MPKLSDPIRSSLGEVIRDSMDVDAIGVGNEAWCACNEPIVEPADETLMTCDAIDCKADKIGYAKVFTLYHSMALTKKVIVHH